MFVRLFVCLFTGPVPATVTTLSQAASLWPLNYYAVTSSFYFYIYSLFVYSHVPCRHSRHRSLELRAIPCRATARTHEHEHKLLKRTRTHRSKAHRLRQNRPDPLFSTVNETQDTLVSYCFCHLRQPLFRQRAGDREHGMRFSHALFTCVSVCSFQRSVSSPDRVVLGRDLPPRCVSNLSVCGECPQSGGAGPPKETTLRGYGRTPSGRCGGLGALRRDRQ